MSILQHASDPVKSSPDDGRPSDTWLRTHCYVCSDPVTDPKHMGWNATCRLCRLYLDGGADALDVRAIRRAEIAAKAVEQAHRCESCGGHHDEAAPADWPSWTDELALSLLDPADDVREEPTPDDWREFGDWSAALDAAWLADQRDLDEPDPSTLVDYDALYHERREADYPATLGIGHPAQED